MFCTVGQHYDLTHFPYVSNHFPAENVNSDGIYHGTNVVLFCCYLIIYLILYTQLLILAHHIYWQSAKYAPLTG